jgi:hypothetical protein
MARQCAIPVTLQQTVAQQNELRSEPSLAPWSLLVGLIASLAIGGGILWHSNQPLAAEPTSNIESTEQEELSINQVTKNLGCAPGAILPWHVQPEETSPENTLVSPAVTGQSLQQKMRFASECLVGVTIAVTVLLALTHGQFGDWLIANPLTAWGRWLGS